MQESFKIQIKLKLGIYIQMKKQVDRLISFARLFQLKDRLDSSKK